MNQATHKIATMCRVLGVSTSGYYAWQRRGPSLRVQQDALMVTRIRALHERSRGTYGVPRIHAQLRAQGITVGRKRIARLMHKAGLQGVSRRKKHRTTIRNEKVRPAADLVERDFSAQGPNQLWVADITYIRTGSGFLYLAVVVDAFSRRVVGWAMKTHLRTELVLEALEMALWQRRPHSVIHHSDQGTQYTSIAFGARCRRGGVRPSMGSVGDCYDNALCESFFASLECELLDRNRFPTPAQARSAVFDFIEGFYNPHRLHSSLGYHSPAEFERRYATLPTVPN
jgi:putative transposase